MVNVVKGSGDPKKVAKAQKAAGILQKGKSKAEIKVKKSDAKVEKKADKLVSKITKATDKGDNKKAWKNINKARSNWAKHSSENKKSK